MLSVCSNHGAGPAGKEGTCGMGKGSGMWVEVSDAQRGCAGTWVIHKYVCACEPGECHECACSSDLLPLPAQE